MLGSSNVLDTSAGAVENESDFYPFGGEDVVTQNLTNQHYKFEGKERDPETGLDNFVARFSNSNMGRFMSPDWSDESDPVPYSELSNPQTLNLYAFAQNNPESTPDLDGHFTTPPWDAWWSGSGNHQNASMCDFGIGQACAELDDIPPMPYDTGMSYGPTIGGLDMFHCTSCHSPSPEMAAGQRNADIIDAEFYAILRLLWTTETRWLKASHSQPAQGTYRGHRDIGGHDTYSRKTSRRRMRESHIRSA